MDPVFATSTSDYTADVDNATTGTTITATPTEAAAAAVITATDTDGTVLTVTSDVVSGLTVGDNNITITVTAEDGNTQEYTITVTRAAASTDASLSALSLSAGTLDPVFATSTSDLHRRR